MECRVPMPLCCPWPSDLVDPPGGQHQVVLGVDDELQRPHWRERLRMPRSDLAALAVQALLLRDEGQWRHDVRLAKASGGCAEAQ